MEIFFDLDGTLIDISKKHYMLYRDIILKLHGIPLSFSAYWKLKRNKTAISIILQKSNVLNDHLNFFNEDFKKNIETPYYLSFDELFPYTKKTLDTLIISRSDMFLV